MAIEMWLLYAATVCVLIGTPWPGQLLMPSNRAANRLRRGWFARADDLTANMLWMLGAALGLAAVLPGPKTL